MQEVVELDQVQSLEPVDQKVVYDATERIQNAIRTSAEFIIQIGKDLIEIKERLIHGNFELFVEDNFEFSASSARRFMQVAQRFDKTLIVSDLISPSSLYALVGPNCPPVVIDRAIETMGAGEKVALVDIKAWIEEYNSTKKIGSGVKNTTELHKIDGLALRMMENPDLYLESQPDKITETIGNLTKLLTMLKNLERAKR